MSSRREDNTAIIKDWVTRTFGEEAQFDVVERVARLLEDAVELAQSEGLVREQAEAIVHRVYSLPGGEPWQEAGGVAVTFLAYCAARHYHPDEVEFTEIRRILSVPAKVFRARQAAKAIAGVGVMPGVVDDPLAQLASLIGGSPKDVG